MRCIMVNGLSNSFNGDEPEVDGIRPLGWESKHAFFTGVMEKLAPNLEVLEVPANLSCMRALGRPSSLFDFSSFTKLRQLSVSMDALYYHKRRLSLPSPWPVSLLPPNLRILRISESFLGTTIFVEDVCKVKKQGMSLQFLERVEVIYKYPYEIVIKAASDRNVADPVYDMGSFCSSAEIAISLYFPGVPMMTPHVNRSLWSLREFGEMTQIEWEVYSFGQSRSGIYCPETLSFEEWRFPERLFSFDADGDMEMQDA